MDRKTLLIYENMLESIATVRSECTTKPENKTGCNTDHIVPNLIDFLVITEKRSEQRLKKEIFTFVKNIVLTKCSFLVSIFYEFLEHHMQK